MQNLKVMAMSVLLSLTACSAEQGYLSAQGWQRNQCLQLPDKAQADRCMSNASTSYGSYQQQTGAGQK